MERNDIMYRVIWQYSPSRVGTIKDLKMSGDPLPSPGESLFSEVPLLGRPEPVFRPPSRSLRDKLSRLPDSFTSEPMHDLAAYYHAFVRSRPEAERLRDRLRNEPDISYAEIQARPEEAFFLDRLRYSRQVETITSDGAPLPGPPATFESLQRYLDPAPTGIDARHAWSHAGGRGDKVTIVDIEHGWNFEHEDLRQNQSGVFFGVSNDSDHGTAVLGIYSGDHNGFGVKGIAPEARAAAASATYDSVRGKWNAADAIRAAADRLSPGDVILLEMHAPGPNATGQGQMGYIPVEYWRPEFAAIRYATQRGIYVVEAAGNGGEDLDSPVYQGTFSRSLRDSGAILVGAGASPFQQAPRSRLWWSNHGSRVDVHGWGEDIVTTGGRSASHYRDLVDDPDPSRCYTQSFGGTSGASPMVVGAVACISGIVRAAGHLVLSPAAMRQLLSDTGTPQEDGAGAPKTQSIGPLPDLRRCIERLLA
jgi:hypothetical protein